MATRLKGHAYDKAKRLVCDFFILNARTSLSSGLLLSPLQLSPRCLGRSVELSQHSFTLCEMTFRKKSSPTRQNKCPICHPSTKPKQNGTERNGASCAPSSSGNMKIKRVKDSKNHTFTHSHTNMSWSWFGIAAELKNNHRRKTYINAFFAYHFLFRQCNIAFIFS